MQVLIASVGKSPGLATSGLRLKDSDTVFNERAVRLNASIVDYCRISAAAISGAAAGIILGLTGLNGFAFFIVFSLALSLMLAMKAGSNWNNYFTTRRQIWFDEMIGGLFTYVLLWTFLYGMVHVY